MLITREGDFRKCIVREKFLVGGAGLESPRSLSSSLESLLRSKIICVKIENRVGRGGESESQLGNHIHVEVIRVIGQEQSLKNKKRGLSKQ